MIKQWYRSLRAPKIYTYTSPVEDRLCELLKVSVDEIRRREKIVQEEVKKVKWRLHQELYPASAEDMEKYGKVTLEGICHNLSQYGTISWYDKCPLILHVALVNDPTKRLNCGVHWLSEKEPVKEANA